MSLLSTAISGLQASQTALRTTGHNISNANTDGYSRQQVQFGTRSPQLTGGGYIGNGVNTQSIERVVNQFVSAQLRSDTTAFNELETFNQQIRGISSLVADAGTGMSQGLQKFFAAVQGAADDPSSTPARQLVISEGESLTARFNVLYGRFDAMNTSISRELGAVVSEVNALAKSIGNLNISIQEQIASGNSPNDLLDQRDEKLRKLAELVSIQVIEQDKGSVNVTIGSGQALVVGRAVSELRLENGSDILITNRGTSVDISSAITGGKLGGLTRFRDEVLSPAFNELGRIAIVLADEFNRIQHQGLDLDGDYGANFFTNINHPSLMGNRVLGFGDNAYPNDRDIDVEITDVSKLTVDDYTLEIVPGTTTYRVLRNTDGSEVTQGILSGVYPASISFEGITVHLNSGSFQGGDKFLIQPTRRGAVDIDTQISRPADLAFALPIRTVTAEGNIGSGLISAGEVMQVVDADGNLLPAFAQPGELSPPLLIQFTSPTTYDVLDNSDPGNPRHLDPPLRNQAFVPGQTNLVFSDDPGLRIVSGDGASMGLPTGRVATVQAIGGAALPNGYPVEMWRIASTDPISGAISTQTVTPAFNASANTTALMLSNLPGVNANAFTEAVITDTNIASFSAPLQLRLNGQELLPYEAGNIASEVPNPASDEAGFYDFLAERINNNPNLRNQGFYAVASSHPITGAPELQISNSRGFDTDIRIEGAVGDNISVNDGLNANVRLTAAGAGQEAKVTVGGRIDVSLDDGVEMTTVPGNSQFFGDSSSANFAQNAYTGYQVSLSGNPGVGDRFEIEFNLDATVDNRNALKFAALETLGVVAGDSLSLAGGYGQMVERLGTASGLSEINTEASKSLLQETESMRQSISGVNLDEEAAHLVRFEQVYNANARVISVARDLFNTLLDSV